MISKQLVKVVMAMTLCCLGTSNKWKTKRLILNLAGHVVWGCTHDGKGSVCLLFEME